jgi:hypothetical protein
MADINMHFLAVVMSLQKIEFLVFMVTESDEVISGD